MADIVDGKRKYKYNDFNPDNIINRSMVISGQSDSGKSFVLNSVMAAISKKVGRVFAFAPTADADDKFPLDRYTHPGLIRNHLDMPLIRRIHDYLTEYKKQLRKVKNLGNIQLLAKVTVSILLKISHKFDSEAKYVFGRIESKIRSVRKVKTELGSKHAKDLHKDDRDKLTNILVDAYAWAVIKGCRLIDEFSPKSMPSELRKAYECLIFNPKTVILINDLSSDLRTLAKDDLKIFENLLNQGRHSELTVIILLHDWICLRKELRNAVHNHIFTTIEMVNNFISIQQYRGETAKVLRDAATTIIQRDRELPPGKRKYSVIFWMVRTGNIEYVIADARGRQVPVGVKYYYELAKKQQKREELF